MYKIFDRAIDFKTNSFKIGDGTFRSDPPPPSELLLWATIDGTTLPYVNRTLSVSQQYWCDGTEYAVHFTIFSDGYLGTKFDHRNDELPDYMLLYIDANEQLTMAIKSNNDLAAARRDYPQFFDDPVIIDPNDYPHLKLRHESEYNGGPAVWFGNLKSYEGPCWSDNRYYTDQYWCDPTEFVIKIDATEMYFPFTDSEIADIGMISSYGAFYFQSHEAMIVAHMSRPELFSGTNILD